MSSAWGLGRKIFGILASLLSLGLIFYTLKPVFNWYLEKTPALGVDLYNSATYVSYHLRNFSLPFNSFKDIWFGGYPLFRDFPQLHYYFMVPFAKFFGLITGVQIYVIFTLILLAFSSLLLYQVLSKNIVLALVLVLLVIYSVNLYGAATWGGSLPYFATQWFLPLGLFLILKFRQTQNRKWFLIAILLSGIASFGHPLPTFTFLFPSAALVLLFWRSEDFSPNFIKRLKDIFLFVLGSILVALPVFYQPLVHLISAFFQGFFAAPITFVAGESQTGQPSETAADIANFYKGLTRLLITDTNIFLFYLLGAGFVIFLVSLPFLKNKLIRFSQVLTFVLISLFVVGHVFVNAYGRPFLSQGWYRAFWPAPIVLGGLAAVLWGQFFGAISERFLASNKLFPKVISLILILVFSGSFAVLGFYIYYKQPQKIIEKIEAKSELSSAFPEVLSIKTDDASLHQLKKQLTPTFLNPDDKNKRLYTADATVNIWWNSLNDMPLARGYVDPPIGAGDRGGFFWLDIAIANDSLTRDFGISEETAYNNALFLIDWYGVYYFEGGRLGSKGPSPPPSSYLLKNNIFDKEEEVTTYGAVLKWQTASGKPELHMEIPQHLKFYKIGEKFTSPILAPTNTSPVIVFSDYPGYEDFLRVIASQNLNSKKIIPVYGGKIVDKLSFEQLKDFDAVILHQYSYKNRKKTFETLENYVRNGGKLFIDTGGDVKESNSATLPEVFPIKNSLRKGQGKSWDFTPTAHEVINGVDFSQFGPPIFNQDEWKVATPQSEVDLREGSTVLLKHKGRPVLVERKFGGGRVLWSGLNLFYHFNQYKVLDEARLFTNILSQFTNISEREVILAKTSWFAPEKVRIETDKKASGILFKEQGYEGWNAKLISQNDKKLPVYLAGPTFPGFMYVPLKNLEKFPFTVEFNYRGETTAYLVFAVSLILVVILLELILFNGILFGKRLGNFYQKIDRKIHSWWEREEE